MRVTFMLIETISFNFDDEFEVVLSVWFASTDMEFVQNFTPPDFQAKNFTPSISSNFNSLI